MELQRPVHDDGQCSQQQQQQQQRVHNMQFIFVVSCGVLGPPLCVWCHQNAHASLARDGRDGGRVRVVAGGGQLH